MMIAHGLSTDPLGGSIMKKLVVLLLSVSALSLAACGDQTAQNTPPATPPASADATKTTTTDPAKPADTVAPATAVALDPTVQTMIEGLKAKAATMSPEDKTKSVGEVRAVAEAAAKTAGKTEADIKSMGDAAEAAIKSAFGM
jgi:ABC-type oligopeptide transport system substrate-binding subunit